MGGSMEFWVKRTQSGVGTDWTLAAAITELI